MDLRLLSYNLLAPIFVRVPGQPYAAFAHAREQDLAWTAREARILERLDRHPADVICLQEVEYEPAGDEAWSPPAWLRRWAEGAAHEVVAEPLDAGEWRRRANRNQRKVGRGTPSGLVTLVRDGRGRVDVQGSAKAILTRFGTREHPVTVVNVHLEGHPEKGASRVKQLQRALERARSGKPSHVIVIGDWNTTAEPTTPVGAALAEVEGMRRIELGPTWVGEPGRPRAVDHLLVDDTLIVVKARVELSEADRRQGMPNPESPSDHAPVYVELRAVDPPRSVPASEPAERPLPPEEAAALEARWRALLAEAPPRPIGPPSPDALRALRAFKAKKQAFLDGLPSDRHRAFVRKRG